MRLPVRLPASTLDRVAGASLFAFALTAFLATGAANLSLAVLLLASLFFVARNGVRFSRDPFQVLVLIIIAYVILSAAIAPDQPHLKAADHWHAASHWLMLCLFIPVAFWLNRLAVNPLLLLLACGIGLWVDLVYMSLVEWDRLVNALHAGSFGYDFGRPQIATGLYVGTSLFGLLVFFPRLLHSPPGGRTVLTTGIWLLLLGWLGFALIVTTSRGAWLSLVVAAAGAAAASLVRMWRRRSPERPALKLLWPLLLSALIIIGIGIKLYPLLQQRLSVERGVISRVFTDDWSKLPYTSVGIRAHMLLSGRDKWLERPLTGWGPAETKKMMKCLDDEFLRFFPHFHNQYIEMLVRLGLVGFVLYFGIIVLLNTGLWRACLDGRLAWDTTLFLSGSWVLSLVWGMTSTRWTHPDWMYYWIVLAGVSLSFIWRAKQKPAADEASTAGSGPTG